MTDAAPGTSTPLLEVAGLTVRLPVSGELRTVLEDVSFSIAAGEALALVGESGSGKSMTARAIVRLLPENAAVEGTVTYDGADVYALRRGRLRSYRHEVSMVYQDPRAHTNPVRRIGDFMTETLRETMSRADADRRAVEALDEVGIDDSERRLRQFPHQLSGGMLQRVMIATALLTRPRLILADEPTTALDVTIQAEVMAIIDVLRRQSGVALLFITHDLDLASAVCDRTAVMYAGQIVEVQTASALHDNALHPYSAALAAARPNITTTEPRLATIPGRPLSAFEAPEGCAFAPRCGFVQDRCRAARPAMREFGRDRARCVRVEELRVTLQRGIHDAAGHDSVGSV
jgi:oligopeptide/dipeptide ABC transporter ATP-binding protein